MPLSTDPATPDKARAGLEEPSRLGLSAPSRAFGLGEFGVGEVGRVWFGLGESPACESPEANGFVIKSSVAVDIKAWPSDGALQLQRDASIGRL